MAMATLPTPPRGAGHDNFLPPGLTPCSSQRMTLCMAVNPAVPMPMACCKLKPLGNGTTYSAASLAYCE